MRPMMTAVFLASLWVTPALSQVGNNTDILNPNLAVVDELVALPQVDAALAKAIIDRRPFLTMTALHELLSERLADVELTNLYTGMFVPVDLNTAGREEILLVPGVGARMAHEFEEYRPYQALAQFRREIGKYVDDDEVARMEQFVFVPIKLNSASDEDILSIPGVGRRMLHEFKEYRPYSNIQQFRREIGKYVDDDEVARLERYVTVN